jgi:hypothetical protein
MASLLPSDEERLLHILKSSDGGVKQSELLGDWTSSIARNSKY